MLNTELLRETMAFILQNPDQWDQGHWASEKPGTCGTAYCFAGTALHLLHPRAPMVDGWKSGRSGRLIFEKMEISKGVVVNMGEQATLDLGLEEDQTDALFEAGNTLPDLLRMVAALLEDPEISGDELEDLRP